MSFRTFDNRLPGVAPLPPPPERRGASRPLTPSEKKEAYAKIPKCSCGSCLSRQRVEEGIDKCPACERRSPYHKARTEHHSWWSETRRLFGDDMDEESMNTIAEALGKIRDELEYNNSVPLVILVNPEN